MTTWSDAELYRRCRREEPAAWKELVGRFTPLVYRLATRMLNDPTEASDVAQEVLLRVHRSLSGYDPTRPMAPWIHRIAYNACLRRLERVRQAEPMPEETSEGIHEDGPTTPPDPEREVGRNEAHRYLVDAMSHLSAQDRGLLVLRYREGLSDAEVAEVTGMPVNTIKTRIFRARRTLRELLSGVLEEVVG